jgi:Flp pilus assembly CpaF family ATPase
MSITSLDIIAQCAGPIPALSTQENILDVCVNPDGVTWVNRLGPGFPDEGVMTPSDVELLISGIATEQSCQLNAAHPILETTFPLTGDRIEGMMRPVVTDAPFAIRTRSKQIFTLGDFGEQGVLTGMSDPLNAKCLRTGFLDHVCGNHMNVIRLANRYYQNILLVRPVGSTKTTFGNALIAEWFEQTPGDRVVVIEDTPELHVLALRASRLTNEPRSCASAAAFETQLKERK